MHILHRNEELDRTQNEDFVVKRERRSKWKAQFRTQLHGGGMELESTEGSTSSVAVVGTGEAIMSLDNPIVYNRYYLEKPPHFTRFMIHVASFGICK